MGACLLVRGQAADTVGLFDEDFFMFSEETDWCYRFRKAGWKVLFYPGAAFVHVGGATTAQNWGPMYREQLRGHLRFLAKHRGRREAEREWLWHDNADVVDWPTGPAQAGDVDWALGTYARLRRGGLALERGDRRGGCGLIRRVQELWTRADAAFAPYRAAADSLARECAR